MLQRLSIVVVLLLSAACATPSSQPASTPVRQRVTLPDALPESLDNQGLLVATIAGNAVALGVYEMLSFSLAGVQIDDTYYSNAVRRNQLVLPLKPGDYTFEALHVYRASDDRAPGRYPMRDKFRIVANQATNLGTIVLLPQKGEDKRFWKIRVDNTDDMTAYLKRRYPKLAGALRPPVPVLASGLRYADATMLEAARRDIARDVWSRSEDIELAVYAGGEAGTIAKILRDSQGKVASFDVLDTGTTAAMVSCSGGDPQRFVCSSDEPALYVAHGTKVERRPLPVPAAHVWVHAFPPRGLVLVDERLNVYSSNDDGGTWTKSVWYAVKEPLNPLARVKFANGKNGYYVYATFTVDPLAPEVLYSEYGRANYQPVSIPKMRTWERLMETPAGLIVGPQNVARKEDKGTLYFRPAGKTEWQARAMPAAQCYFLQRARENRDLLRVYCGSTGYFTSDAGRTWTERVPDKK